MLTEGKHWPEDYLKTAINTIKNSWLGKQSWYIDDYLLRDLVGPPFDTKKTQQDPPHDINNIDVKDVSRYPSQYGILGDFEPLMHETSNFGWFALIIRWFVEYTGTSFQKYQDFLEGKLDTVIKTLLRIVADKSYDSQRDAIKKMSFVDFEKLAEQINAKAAKEDIVITSRKMKYNVVPIHSYHQLNSMYGGYLTGYRGKSDWCHTNVERTYNGEAWTNGGKNMLFVIEAEDWQDIKAPDVPFGSKSLRYPEYSCYDDYGMSLIAILVNVESGKLLKSTSRWNHIILPKSGAADSMFESWQQLNKAVGFDVEKICYDECQNAERSLHESAQYKQISFWAHMLDDAFYK